MSGFVRLIGASEETDSVIEDPGVVKLILQGKVTQLRRPVPRGRRHRLDEGQVHAIHRPHGEKATRIIIREVRRECLGDATIEDARREGCARRPSCSSGGTRSTTAST